MTAVELENKKTLLEASLSDDPGDWPYFSYSQLTTFDRCEFKWYLSYMENWTPKSIYAPQMDIGTLVHKMMDIYYKNLNSNPAELIDEFLNREIQNAFEDGGDPEELNKIAQAGSIMRRYVADYAPKNDANWVIQGVERQFSVPFTTPKGRHFILLGYVDLVILVNGTLTIVDHKTVSNAGFWKQGETQMDPQMTLYAAALRREGLPVGEILHNFLNTYPYKNAGNVPDVKLFKRDSTYRTDVELNNFVTEMFREIDDIIEKSSENWVPRRSLRRDCSRCNFKDPCYYSLKGIDVSGVMVSKYKKKEKTGHGIR